ncbi:beta-ketoacyl-[acyl-carrier-protein] synthase family protein [Ruminococcus sp.]
MKKEGRRVVVTGIGLLTSNGLNREQVFTNCADGVNGLVECTLFDAKKLKTAHVGQIQDETIPYLTNHAQDKERIQYILDRVIDEAMQDAAITKEEITELGIRASVSFATSLAANGRISGYVAEQKQKGQADPEWLNQIPAFTTYIKHRCGAQGSCYTTMSACAAGSTAAGIAFDLIQENKADVVLVGGADPLTEFSCVGFHVLRSLSSSVCRPFDDNRDGINIGEGGAFFVVETLEHAKARNARIYGEIVGYGLNNDAYHITSPDPEGFGAYESMRVASKGISLDEVDYINAHGTGTRLNDEMESKVIARLFPDRRNDLCVSSTKSMIGHCLAAAGAIEMAVTLMTLQKGIVTPTIRMDHPMQACKEFDYVTEKRSKNIRYALSNSFAFAGNTASLLLGSYNEDEKK